MSEEGRVGLWSGMRGGQRGSKGESATGALARREPVQDLALGYWWPRKHDLSVSVTRAEPSSLVPRG